MGGLTHIFPLSNFFCPWNHFLFCTVCIMHIAKSRDLFLAPAQSAGVDVYLTVGVLARLIAKGPINFNLLFFALGDCKAYPAH